jgi:formate hydrogenlyase transcriptional activator
MSTGRRDLDSPTEPSYPGVSFELLLAEIAVQLLGAPPESMDAHLTDALSRLVKGLEVERGIIALVDPTDGKLRVTRSWTLEGLPPGPLGTPELDFPWLRTQIVDARIPFISSGAGDFPPEAASDRGGWGRLGQKSAAVFPIEGGGRLLGVFSFGTVRAERAWPQPLIDRLRLVGEVLAGALLRREHERTLRTALAEIEALHERLRAENQYLRKDIFAAEGFEDIVGESVPLRSVLFQVERVAPTDATVLILGETGTGKELVAKAIHAKSARRDRVLVKVNCAALAPTLIESELFGHEKGAFTGAASRTIGRFELADQSTLFLDEVGELPLALQTKLLRVLQEGEFERLGSPVSHKVNVRVIAASNRDLAAAVREGTFRADLYYRLRVFPIEVPPLRARKGDIPLLVWYFVGQLAAALGKKIDRIAPSAMERLLRYDWPGNIRELRNVLERAMILSPEPVLLIEEPADTLVAVATPADAGGVRSLEDVERDHIVRVLELCDWRVRGAGNAAKRLGLNASTLYSRMKKLGIRPPGEPRRGQPRPENPESPGPG